MILRKFVLFTCTCFIIFYFFASKQTLHSSSICPDYQGDLFIAVDIPENVKTDIQIIQTVIQTILGDSFIPTQPENFHITIQVIGKTFHDNILEAIDPVLEDVKQHQLPFNLETELALGTIKINRKNVKLNFTSDILTKFAKEIRTNLKINGIKVSSRFDFPKNAHITLGNFYKKISSKKKRKINKALKNVSDLLQIFTQDQFQVTSFSILKSNYPEPIDKRHYAMIRNYKIAD